MCVKGNKLLCTKNHETKLRMYWWRLLSFSKPASFDRVFRSLSRSSFDNFFVLMMHENETEHPFSTPFFFVFKYSKKIPTTIRPILN